VQKGWKTGQILSSKSQTHILAAMGAGLINVSVTNPFWVVKVRMQAQSHREQYKTIVGTAYCIWSEEGLRSFLKGLPLSLLGTIHVGIQFPLYEYIKDTQKTKGKGNLFLHLYSLQLNYYLSEKFELRNVVFASTLSKITAGIITYPLEPLRTRLQNSETREPIIAMMSRTIAKEGPMMVFKGMGINVLRSVPSAIITLTTFEYISAVLKGE
jgi:solute carrier family 25 folate transporter 32